MRLTIEQAEKLLDDLATQEELLCKRADDASGYTRSGNESIRTSNAKTHEQHAKEYRQLAEWLRKLQRIEQTIKNDWTNGLGSGATLNKIEGILGE